MPDRRDLRNDAGIQDSFRTRPDADAQSRPAYRRIAASLRDSIDSGEYVAGRPLPTEAELGRVFEVSRQTIRRAFRDLVSEGLVYRVAGRGTFVTRAPVHGRYLRSVGTVEDLEAWRGSEMDILGPVELTQEPLMAERLELEDSVVASLRLLRLKGDVAFGLTHVYLPPSLGNALTEAGLPAERSPGTVIGRLRELGLTDVLEAEQVISAVEMPDDVAHAIAGSPGEPALKVERTYFDTRGRPVEVAVTLYNPANYDHRISVRRQYPR